MGVYPEDIGYLEITENIQDVLLIMDKDCRIEWINNCGQEFSGFDSDEMTEKNLRDLIHPEDIQDFDDAIHSLKNGGAMDIQIRIIDRNDDIVYIQLIGSLLKKSEKILIQIKDIGENVKAKEELRKRNEFIETILDNLPIGIATNAFDEGVANYMNSKFQEIYGWTDEDLENIEEFFDRVYPDSEIRDELKKRVMDDINSGDPERMHWENLEVTQKNGSKKIISAQNIPLIDQNVMVSTVWDVTDRHLAEKFLKESEERFILAMEATNDGLFDWDLKTNRIYYSPSWKRMLGYEDHELENDFSTWERLTHPEDVKKSWSRLKAHLGGEIDRFEMEFRMKHKDGHWVDILSRAEAQFDQGGEPCRVVGTHIDITDRKRMEKELNLSRLRYMEEKRRAELYLDLLSHDIGNLHQGIASFAELALRGLENDEVTSTFLRNIRKLAKRSNNLIKNVKILSRIRESENKFIPLDITNVVNESISMTRNMFPDSNVKINFIQPDERIRIKAEPVIQNIFVNIIHNGIKAQTGEEKILDIHFDVIKDRKEVIVNLADHGPGIDRKRKGELLERSSHCEEKKHSGVGLMLVKNLVERYGGEIEVRDRIEGDPSSGALFRIRMKYLE